MVNLVDPEVVPEQFHKHSELVGDENKPIISMMSRESVDAYALSMLSILATDYIQKRRGQASGKTTTTRWIECLVVNCLNKKQSTNL